MLNKKGLTLVETLVASAVITTLMLASIPPSVKMLQQKVAENTAREITQLQEAEKNYWIDKLNQNGTGQWATLNTLKNEGYVKSDWSGKNLFGYDYTISTDNATCTISTTIPRGLEGVIQTLCPNVSTSTSPVGSNYIVVSSTIPIPGQEPTMETTLHRYSNDPNLRTATQPIAIPKLVMGKSLDDPDPNFQNRIQDQQDSDIYIHKLKQAGISTTGWLSDAQFPANLRTGYVRASTDGYRVFIDISPWLSITNFKAFYRWYYTEYQEPSAQLYYNGVINGLKQYHIYPVHFYRRNYFSYRGGRVIFTVQSETGKTFNIQYYWGYYPNEVELITDENVKIISFAPRWDLCFNTAELYDYVSQYGYICYLSENRKKIFIESLSGDGPLNRYSIVFTYE